MNWIKKFFDPKESQFEGDDLDEFRAALNDAEVRTVWFEKLIEAIRGANLAIDGLLDKEDRQRKWEIIAIERRTLVRMVRMILDARQDIENRKVQEERENRLFEIYRGAAAPLDNRR